MVGTVSELLLVAAVRIHYPNPYGASESNAGAIWGPFRIPIRYRTIAYDWHTRLQLSSIRLPW